MGTELNLTLALVILTVLISYQAFTNPELRSRLIFHPAAVKNRGEYYRFITHGFIHSDWNHLLINMFVFWQFGGFVEAVFVQALFGPLVGHLVFLLFYLSAIAAASYFDYQRHQNNYSYAALGASGAVSAATFAYILFRPWAWFLFPPVPSIVFGVLYLWYSSYMDQRGGGNIGHNAHLWGGIYGFVFMLLLLLLFGQQFLPGIIEGFLSPQPPPFL